jgi:AraC family transcriptional regulator
MKRTNGWTDYEERLNRVTAFIHEHLDEEMSLDRLAGIACLSPCHWHRTYHALHGETIAATVKRLRLQRAAGYLAQTAMPVAEIAGRSGYDNVQSFTRVFRTAFGMPPAAYRRAGSHVQFEPQRPNGGAPMHDVDIRTMPALVAIGVRHAGSYIAIGKAFARLQARLAAGHLARPGLRMVAIYEDDPSAVAEADLRSRACVIVEERLPVEAPLEIATIAAGPYAVLRHQGPYADMKAAYRWLYGTWLVQSGREADDAPVVEEYLNSPHDTAPTDLLTDIYLPLRAEALP